MFVTKTFCLDPWALSNVLNAFSFLHLAVFASTASLAFEGALQQTWVCWCYVHVCVWQTQEYAGTGAEEEEKEEYDNTALTASGQDLHLNIQSYIWVNNNMLLCGQTSSHQWVELTLARSPPGYQQTHNLTKHRSTWCAGLWRTHRENMQTQTEKTQNTMLHMCVCVCINIGKEFPINTDVILRSHFSLVIYHMKCVCVWVCLCMYKYICINLSLYKLI